MARDRQILGADSPSAQEGFWSFGFLEPTPPLQLECPFSCLFQCNRSVSDNHCQTNQPAHRRIRNASPPSHKGKLVPHGRMVRSRKQSIPTAPKLSSDAFRSLRPLVRLDSPAFDSERIPIFDSGGHFHLLIVCRKKQTSFYFNYFNNITKKCQHQNRPSFQTFGRLVGTESQGQCRPPIASTNSFAVPLPGANFFRRAVVSRTLDLRLIAKCLAGK